LTRKLRTGRPLRKRRRNPVARSPRFIAAGRLIDQRPVEVEHRARIGDWEGGLTVGRMSRSAIGTLVDRRTGYLRLVHLPDGHGAEQLRIAVVPVLARMPALVRQTLTWDQGSEMACHASWPSSSPTASSEPVRRQGISLQASSTVRRREVQMGGAQSGGRPRGEAARRPGGRGGRMS
jgi:IS30 family transposase